MKTHFVSRRQKVRRFFKRSPMDTGYDDRPSIDELAETRNADAEIDWDEAGNL